MALSSQQRGRIFERFINEILFNSGFRTVVPDGLIVYQSPSGLMLQGLAQPHNTDVLVNPPFQIPFFFPTSLIIECKCYKTAIGLPVIRNALGLREDVNGFDIVTDNILRQRKNYSRRRLAVFDRERCFYQVAVASLSGFTQSAQEFALVHHIPLINYKRMPLSQDILNILFEGEAGSQEEQLESPSTNNNLFIDPLWENLKEQLKDILNKLCVAILSSGDIFFLYTKQGRNWFFDAEVEEIALDRSEDNRLWQISPHNPDNQTNTSRSLFELPDIMLNKWTCSKIDRKEALDMKKKYFKNIYVMGKADNGEVRLKVLRLSEQFIEAARKRLNQNSVDIE